MFSEFREMQQYLGRYVARQPLLPYLCTVPYISYFAAAQNFRNTFLYKFIAL